MLRRQKAGADRQPTPSSPLVPLGGDTQVTPASSTKLRRRRKKHRGCLRSCLVSLGLVNDRKTLSGKPKGSTRRGGDWIPLCAVLSSLACFFVVTMSIYTYVVGTENQNLILQATTHIDSEMIDALLELRPSVDEEEDLPLLFFQQDKQKHRSKHHHSETDGEFYYPSRLSHHAEKEADYIDFGGIDVRLLPDDDHKRQIYIMVEDLQGDPRSLDQERDDDYEIYWNFDDDKERNPYLLYTAYDKSMEGRCRRTSWHRGHYPICNSMHELDLLTNTPRFVGYVFV